MAIDEQKVRKRYKTARSNLRAIPILIYLGAAVTLYQSYNALQTLPTAGFEGIRTLIVAEMGLAVIFVVAGVGLHAWQDWARIALVVLLILGVFERIGVFLWLSSLGIRMQMPAIVVGLVIQIYIISALVGREARRLIEYRGDLEKAIGTELGIQQAVEFD